MGGGVMEPDASFYLTLTVVTLAVGVVPILIAQWRGKPLAPISVLTLFGVFVDVTPFALALAWAVMPRSEKEEARRRAKLAAKVRRDIEAFQNLPIVSPGADRV